MKKLILLSFAVLFLASCGGNREVEYEVSIDKGEKYLVADSLVWNEGTDSTEREVTYLHDMVEVYTVYVRAEFDNDDCETFSESSYVKNKEEIETLICSLKTKLKKQVDDYYELQDLEESLSNKECN